MNPKLLFWVAFSVVLAACGEGDPPEVPREGCERTAHCPLGRLCRVPAGRCVEVPEDAVMGSFACVVGATENERSETATDITGSLSGFELSYYVGIRCAELDGRFEIVATGIYGDPLTTEYLLISLDPNDLPAQELELDAADPDEPDQLNTALVLGTLADGELVAWGGAAGGFVQFDGDFEQGELLEGYLEIDLVGGDGP